MPDTLSQPHYRHLHITYNHHKVSQAVDISLDSYEIIAREW